MNPAWQPFWLRIDAMLLIVGPLALTWSLTFASHFLRYVLGSGAVAALVRLPALRLTRLQAHVPDPAQRRMEFRASLQAGAIFAVQTLFVSAAMASGHTQIYYRTEEFGVAYLVASFVIAVVIHDTYFYWTHRWMHRPAVFARFHRHHHTSRTPTVWTAFSFHPLESVVEGGINVLLPFVMPLHISVFSMFIVWASFHGAIIHCGHDLLFVRRGGRLRVLTKLLNTTVDHDAHHLGARGNFALYFSFWDRVMKTRVQL